MTQAGPTKHIALQFGHIKHFNEGLSEVSRQLGLHLAKRAIALREERGWQLHYFLPGQWHGLFGDDVAYHRLDQVHRYRHNTSPTFDVWHGLHQHMRYRAPANSRFRIVTVHDLNHCHAKTGVSLWWQNLRLRRQLQGADRLVAISEFVRQDIQRYWSWASSVDVIHNGVVDLSQACQETVEQLEGEKFLLHLSRMSASKNVTALLNMAEIWPDQLFVLAGPASDEIAQHQVNAGVRKLGNVLFFTDVSEAQKAWLYRHCAAFLFPSLMEGFGLPPIEAMYFGKPVLVARRSCLPEICGNAAFYWDEFDPFVMRKVTEEAICMVEREHGFAARIRLTAKKYAWEEAAAGYLRLYAMGLHEVKHSD